MSFLADPDIQDKGKKISNLHLKNNFEKINLWSPNKGKYSAYWETNNFCCLLIKKIVVCLHVSTVSNTYFSFLFHLKCKCTFYAMPTFKLKHFLRALIDNVLEFSVYATWVIYTQYKQLWPVFIWCPSSCFVCLSSCVHFKKCITHINL